MKALGWRGCWRIARRDLHRGFRGLRLLFICLFLGVATLATIGGLTAAITGEIASKGQVLLGGDVEVAMSQREAGAAEKAAFRREGALSETIRLRAMAQRVGQGAGNGPSAVLTELKGVDGAYPLYGALVLKGGRAGPMRADELVIGQALADRLDVKPGDGLRYGAATFRIRDIIAEEPDRVGEGFTLGPVALTSMEGIRRSGLIQPGSLYESKYRIRLGAGRDAGAAGDRLKRAFPSAGFEIKDRDGAAPGTSRFLERMGQFLSLIGLAALAIAGIGVSNGVASYLAIKRNGIATLKILGASSADIARIYLMQIGAVAVLAIGCGLAAGVVLPLGLVTAMRDILPVQPGFAIAPWPLVTSALYGLLIAFIFTVPPLARARTLPAAALFRETVDRRRGVDRASMIAVGAAGAAALGLALGTAREPWFAAAMLGAVAAMLALLTGIGLLVRHGARRAPAPRRPLARLAVANLHRPGAQTSALVVALGLGLTLFVTLAAIQSSLSAEIRNTVPRTAPDQFVLDIPIAAKDRFLALVGQEAPGAKVNMAPTLRGTIVAYGGQRVADLKQLPEGAWFLRGERGVTYSDALPEGSELVKGRWWPRDYAGPPLVSLDREAAEVMGVGVGDMLTVSVLGREMEARIASLRQVNWETMGFNYIMVFSPNTLRGAPHSLSATITMKGASEGAMARTLLAAFPSISIIAVGDVVAQVTVLLGQMSTAIVLAGSVAILAGIAVLIGAIAASRQARAYDSVILKTLGATRWQILGAQGIEYALLAGVLALVALGLGLAAGWFVIVRIFEFHWAPDWLLVLSTLGAGAVLTLGIGLLGSIPLMSVRPARALRAL
ncbi:FtsX-like permease family protein [Sphingobium indicum]|uniref:ORFY n=3 Tax=Sphingomonadaceae TaxID=41297 RepID=Q6VQX4_SPHPI|nr:FtsX-like permease family protein [Sphingobium indicum]AAR05977.1 ORFY [Sphingobium indicum B90A]APL96494.1 ABC transporter permease [Sphingobium indicum B90A]NYI23702.1 putative ABC transport system permease protein [Sphingobium indicum]RYM00437.1 FtsX-like permease family protein [Sphingobium indicum]